MRACSSISISISILIFGLLFCFQEAGVGWVGEILRSEELLPLRLQLLPLYLSCDPLPRCLKVKERKLVWLVRCLFYCDTGAWYWLDLEKLLFKPDGYNYWMWRGRKIHYIVDGEGFPIVLIHGFGASAYHWRFRSISFSFLFSFCLLLDRENIICNISNCFP